MCGSAYSTILLFIGLITVSIGIYIVLSEQPLFPPRRSNYRKTCKDLYLRSTYKEEIELMKNIALYHGDASFRSHFYPLSFFKEAIEKKNPSGDQIYHGVTRFNVIADLAIPYFLQGEKEIESLKVRYVHDYTYGYPTLRMECTGYGKTIFKDIVMLSYNLDAIEPDGNLDSVCMCIDAVKKAIEYLKEELQKETTNKINIFYGYSTWTK